MLLHSIFSCCSSMISTDNEYAWSDYMITTASLMHSNDFMSAVGNMMAVAGVQLFNWTITLALASPFLAVVFCPCHVCCPSHSERAVTHTNAEQGFSRATVESSFKGFKGGAGFSRAVTLSLRSRGARLNTSYSNTKRGCDVHTNEPIIGGFVTQFLLSLIWPTNPQCAHACVSLLHPSVRMCTLFTSMLAAC